MKEVPLKATVKKYNERYLFPIPKSYIVNDLLKEGKTYKILITEIK